MAFWADRQASGSSLRGNPPEKRMVAVSGTTTTFSPNSRLMRSRAVVLPPPGPPVRTMRCELFFAIMSNILTIKIFDENKLRITNGKNRQFGCCR